jgi:hypothetical protein
LKLEANDHHSLADLDFLLRNELKADPTAPCAFFMSGDESDESTAFVGAPGAGTTARVRLGAASLETGMQIAYVPHPQSPVFSLEVEQAVETAQAENVAARAIERTGDTPKVPAFDAKELERSIESEEHECCGHSHGECGCGCGEHDCECGCEEHQGEHSCGSESAECGCQESAPSPEEERERQEARASFPAELVEKLDEALDAADDSDDLVPAGIFPALVSALEACSNAADLDRLSTAVGAELDEWARHAIDNFGSSPSELAGLAKRLAKITGKAEDQSLIVSSLTEAGSYAEALGALEALPVHSRLGEDWKNLKRATIQSLAGDSASAEAGLRALLANQWLSGNLRARAFDLLLEILGDGGREQEARKLTQAEKAHSEKLDSLRRMTFERAGTKVSPNDRCPCGSGKKFKKCCGMPA